MNWLEFISSIIESLAWPAALFGILFLFRAKAAALLPYIGKLRYKEFELEFRESMRELSLICIPTLCRIMSPNRAYQKSKKGGYSLWLLKVVKVPVIMIFLKLDSVTHLLTESLCSTGTYVTHAKFTEIDPESLCETLQKHFIWARVSHFR